MRKTAKLPMEINLQDTQLASSLCRLVEACTSAVLFEVIGVDSDDQSEPAVTEESEADSEGGKRRKKRKFEKEKFVVEKEPKEMTVNQKALQIHLDKMLQTGVIYNAMDFGDDAPSWDDIVTGKDLSAYFKIRGGHSRIQLVKSLANAALDSEKNASSTLKRNNAVARGFHSVQKAVEGMEDRDELLSYFFDRFPW